MDKDNRQVEVILKTGSGVEITIKGDMQTIKELVADVQRREDSRVRFREYLDKRRFLEQKNFNDLVHLRNDHLSNSKSEVSSPHISLNLTDRIKVLIRDGFFNEPRKIGDLQTALQARGFHYQTPTLSPALLRSVQRGWLKRTRNVQGHWVYSRDEKK